MQKSTSPAVIPPLLIAFFASAFLSAPVLAQRQMENLDRGLVAVLQEDGSVFAGWRLLGDDLPGTAFNGYRVIDGAAELVNEEPLGGPTSFIDPAPGGATSYLVRPVLGEAEGDPCKPAAVWSGNFIDVPIQTTPGYRPGDCSVGDLDGDGQY